MIIAPIKAELINKALVLLPHKYLAICGTISPTKPSNPAKLTTLDADADAIIMQIILIAFILTPREAAVSFPRHKRLILLEKARQRMKHIKITINGTKRFLYCTPAKPPIENALYETKISPSIRVISEINEFKRALTATPESIIEALVLPVKLDSKTTSRVVKKAPIKAKIGVKIKLNPSGKISESDTKNPAPELTPIMLGEAKEFSVMLCSSTPEIERPTPAIIPDKILGSLTLYKITVFSFPLKNRALKNSLNDIFALPQERARINTNTSTHKRAKYPL